MQTTSFKQLSSDLSLSTYLVKKEVAQLIEDLTFFKITELKLIIENKNVYFFSSGQDSVQTLQWYYLKDSKLFLLLDAIFKDEEFSFEEFSSTYYLSLSATYLLKSDLDKLLELDNIYIDDNLEFVGEEEAIRIFLFDVYFFSFNSLEFPFSKEIADLSEVLLKKIDDLYLVNSSYSQKIKLKFFLAIIFQRIYSGNTISVKKTLEKVPSSRVISIKEWFALHTTLSPDEIAQEVAFIYSFLIAEQLMSSYDKKLANKHIKLNCPEAFRLTTTFLKALKHHFNISENESYYHRLRRNLLQIHYKFLRFTHIKDSYSFESDFVFFKENYPDFYLFIDSFIKKKKLFTLQTGTLQHDYLFLLIQHVPVIIFSTPVYVCVDFLYGKAYNEFIIENIQSFKFLNIIIENTLSEKTNLYLSDIKLKNLPCDYIIWKKPPLASDWEHFGNRVVQIKERKTMVHEKI
ncbi:M protein trans-acting positive regulator [Enterococcus termitis]|nr:M protein trans-acting positive regulator [Enterococcus termitis]